MNEAVCHRILIIDDDPTIRLLLVAGLGRQGFRVAEAEDGPSGLEAFAREHPHLVLVDVTMPGMDGYAVVARLRAMPGGEALPVLMLTAADDAETRRLAAEAGATAVVTKPFQLLPLAEHLRRLLEASA
ncbi:response regulator [Halomonas mongoliensis]|uniref:Response regulator n=1 Tax=Halomonas mongoliensis TaxID=321265 RepID=A0ABU1GHS9_9GAMM|nr:response regulator [Halomonas mongoliensis]MDR5891533.1 response regulator [Halomonas mongoliensis]